MSEFVPGAERTGSRVRHHESHRLEQFPAKWIPVRVAKNAIRQECRAGFRFHWNGNPSRSCAAADVMSTGRGLAVIVSSPSGPALQQISARPRNVRAFTRRTAELRIRDRLRFLSGSR